MRTIDELEEIAECYGDMVEMTDELRHLLAIARAAVRRRITSAFTSVEGVDDYDNACEELDKATSEACLDGLFGEEQRLDAIANRMDC